MELMLTPAVNHGPNIMTDPSGFYDPAIPSSMDGVASSQDSFNLLFQNMPYDVSEPVMCKFPRPMFVDCEEGCEQ